MRLSSCPLYQNVASVSWYFFPGRFEVVDVCGGHSPMGDEFSDRGHPVCVVDSDATLLRKAGKKGHRTHLANMVVEDQRERYSSSCYSLFTNASGSFSLDDLGKVLRHIPGCRLLANFFVLSDQSFRSEQCVEVRDNVWSFRLDDPIVGRLPGRSAYTLSLQGVTEWQLRSVLYLSGWLTRGWISYFDIKFERLYLLERKQHVLFPCRC